MHLRGRDAKARPPGAWILADGLCEIVIGLLLLAGAGGAVVALPIPTWLSVLGAALFAAVGILLIAAAFHPAVRTARPLAVANAAGAVVLVIWFAIGHTAFTSGAATFLIAGVVALVVLAAGEWVGSRPH